MSQTQHNKDRMRRAESWHERSLRAEADDERFIFLWIAFNAAYGRDMNGLDNDGVTPGGMRSRERERRRIGKFLKAVLQRDRRNKIRTMLQEKLNDPVRTLLGNPFVFLPFWWWIRDDKGDSKGVGWIAEFKEKNAKAWEAWDRGDVHGFLTEVMERLYTMRNQVFHGGATYRGGKGREQIRDGAEIMAALVKVTLNIMKADIKKYPGSEIWENVAYPTVSGRARNRHQARIVSDQFALVRTRRLPVVGAVGTRLLPLRAASSSLTARSIGRSEEKSLLL